MNINKFLTVLFFVLLLISGYTYAQKKQELEYSGFFDSYYFRGPVAITVGGGLAGYNGDLYKKFPAKNWGPVISVGANYKVWPRVVFGAEFSYFQLSAKDTLPKISFTSTNMELDLYGRFYFVEDIVRVAADRSKRPKRLKPFVSLGIGGVLYNPKTTYVRDTSTGGVVPAIVTLNDSNSLKFRPSGSGITFVIPVGVGLSYSFSHRVSLIAELTYKYTFCDNLDGVTGLGSKWPDNYYTAQLKLQLAPWAPKVKRKKKYKGQAPADSGGGGTASPNAPSEKPKPEETTAPSNGQETPVPETPAQETPAPETPAQETPAPETPSEKPAPANDGWGDQPQTPPAKPAGK